MREDSYSELKKLKKILIMPSERERIIKYCHKKEMRYSKQMKSYLVCYIVVLSFLFYLVHISGFDIISIFLLPVISYLNYIKRTRSGFSLYGDGNILEGIKRKGNINEFLKSRNDIICNRKNTIGLSTLTFALILVALYKPLIRTFGVYSFYMLLLSGILLIYFYLSINFRDEITTYAIYNLGIYDLF